MVVGQNSDQLSGLYPALEERVQRLIIYGYSASF
jgi:hypothetical protein